MISNRSAGAPVRAPFSPGEKLLYDIRWKGLKVGESINYVKGFAEINGHKTYHIVSETYSTGLIGLIYKVRDIEETFIDTENFYSWQYKKDLNEGRRHDKGEYIFDSSRETVITPRGKYSVPFDCHDPLSVLLYFRFQKIDKDKNIRLNYITDTGMKTLYGKFIREESVKVPLGVFKAKNIEFLIKSNDSEQLRFTGKSWIWFAEQNGALPVLIKFKTRFGYVKALLKEYTAKE